MGNLPVARHSETEPRTWLSSAMSIAQLGSTNALSLHLLEIHPGAHQEPMVHDDMDEIFIVLSGSLVVYVGDDLYEAGPGHAFTVPAGMPHGSLNKSDGIVTMLACHSPGFETATT